MVIIVYDSYPVIPVKGYLGFLCHRITGRSRLLYEDVASGYETVHDMACLCPLGCQISDIFTQDRGHYVRLFMIELE